MSALHSVYIGEWAHFDEEIVMRGRHLIISRILSDLKVSSIGTTLGLRRGRTGLIEGEDRCRG